MMSRENLCQPILSIDLKKSLIRIHRNTLRLLGDPDYIQLLINPNSKAGVIQFSMLETSPSMQQNTEWSEQTL